MNRTRLISSIIACYAAVLTALLPFTAHAETGEAFVVDTIIERYTIKFPVNNYVLNPDFSDNAAHLSEISRALKDADREATEFIIFGGASPEGSVERNSVLYNRRAEALRDYLVRTEGISPSLIKIGAARIPWDLFRQLMAESDFSGADTVLSIISSGSDDDAEGRLARLKKLPPPTITI